MGGDRPVRAAGGGAPCTRALCVAAPCALRRTPGLACPDPPLPPPRPRPAPQMRSPSHGHGIVAEDAAAGAAAAEHAPAGSSAAGAPPESDRHVTFSNRTFQDEFAGGCGGGVWGGWGGRGRTPALVAREDGRPHRRLSSHTPTHTHTCVLPCRAPRHRDDPRRGPQLPGPVCAGCAGGMGLLVWRSRAQCRAQRGAAPQAQLLPLPRCSLPLPPPSCPAGYTAYTSSDWATARAVFERTRAMRRSKTGEPVIDGPSATLLRCRGTGRRGMQGGCCSCQLPRERGRVPGTHTCPRCPRIPAP